MGTVKFKTVSELQREATSIISEIEKSGKQIVITKNGKPMVVMQRVEDEDFKLEKIP